MAACLLVSTAASAQEYLAPQPVASPITDHFAITGDFFWGHVATYGRFDPRTGAAGSGILGTPIYDHATLGLTNQAYQPRIELMFRMEQRHRLRVDFFDLRRSAEKVVNQTLQFGDEQYAVNSLVQSQLNWRQMDLTYTYSFLRGETYELGFGPGFHMIEAEATAFEPSTSQRADFSGAGPFATLALDGTWRPFKKWSLNVRGQYMHVTVSSVGGSLGIYHADVQYRAARNFALGAGYERQNTELDVRHQDPSGFLHLNITGPEAFVRVSF